ncbi:MAG: peptidyl-prolyl cis-trans isomerase [Lachnospiraceae bacterium]|nr:peptidyl-prolyl cis-trans isomerase [Lachnospiraceae bacterium]
MRYHKVFAMVMGLVLLVSLTACGTKDKKVFTVNGESFTYKDVMIFGYIFSREYNIEEATLDNNYEGKVTYRKYYKDELENEIVNTLLLYKEAQTGGMELSEPQQAEELSKVLMEDIGEEALEKYGITQSDVLRVYKMRLMADSYLETFSDEDKKEDEDGADESRYIKVYQVIFPTVELDENGMLQSDENGKTLEVSSAKMEVKKEKADEFAQRIEDGENIEAVVRDYAAEVTAAEQYLRYEDLSPDYKRQIDRLSKGGVSNSFKSDYGYYVVKLLESDAKDYEKALSEHEEETEKQDRAEEELERLYSLYVAHNLEYKEQDLWDSITIDQFVQ